MKLLEWMCALDNVFVEFVAAWDDAARPGIFVGYSEKRRAYKFLSPAAIKSHLRGR